MEARILQQAKLVEFVDELIGAHEVIAPKDDLAYGKVSAASEMRLSDEPSNGSGDFLKPTKSLKELFFPQREVLVEYQFGPDGGKVSTPSSAPSTSRVVFGSRPCDAAALPILDKLFAWDYCDAFYLDARERTVIVSVACDQPCDACFCTSLDGSPASIEGSDVLLTPLGDVYHVQIITERGKALIAEHEALFKESDQVNNRRRVRFEEEVRAKIARKVDIEGLDKALDFDGDVWETLAQQCIDCGICTFLCPTCHCFDIQDEGNPVQAKRPSHLRGERVRLWDACTFFNYTKAHAGQPRPTHYRRYRQRIMHKFRYYPENFGRTLCVGCGRCIEHCPVSIDLRDVLEAVKE